MLYRFSTCTVMYFKCLVFKLLMIMAYNEDPKFCISKNVNKLNIL